MTQSQDLHKDKTRISVAFQTAEGAEIAAFREFWRTNCEQANQGYLKFLQVMNGSEQISFAKVSELEEVFLRLCQYDYVLDEKSKDLPVEGDVQAGVQNRLNDAVKWVAFARQSLKHIRGWTFPMNR